MEKLLVRYKVIITSIVLFFLSGVNVFANNLTPDRALAILDEASSQAVLNRQGHVLIVESVNVLRDALAEKKLPEEEKNIETQPVGIPE